jgi:hypothetical protein
MVSGWIYDEAAGVSAIAAARFLTSPCLPFCMRHKVVSDGVLIAVEQSVGSVAWHVFRGMDLVGSDITHLPLGKSQVHLSSALGSQSLVLLERAADNTGGDGHVTVVAVNQIQQSAFCSSCSCRRLRARGVAALAGSPHLRPAAFQAATIVTVLKRGGL